MLLCCGEALIDMLPDTNAAGEAVLRPVTGGSVFNTAIASGRLGQKTGFLTGLSSDGFGCLLKKDLEDSGVDHSLCVISAKPTTLAVVELQDGNATYTFYDEGSAGRMLHEDDLPAIADHVTSLLFGGICLIPEPCGAAYEALLARVASTHLTYLDPNIRVNFIDDEAKHRARIKRMIANSHVVKVSDEDLSWIAPGEDFETTISTWLEGGTSLVLLSRGEQGSTAFTRSGVVHADAEKIDVVDTVGAGDTFSAGFLASLNDQIGLGRHMLTALNDEVIHQALSFANKTAAITASRYGANPPWLHEVPSV